MVSCYTAPQCECQPPNLGPSLEQTCGLAPTILTFMALLDVYIRKQCDITDPCQRVRPINTPDNSYDFIVVGGGTGGSVVAGRLVEVPQWKVLVIEAGGEEPAGAAVPAFMSNFWGNELVDWNYKTEPQKNACLSEPNHQCSWPRGKALGGTSVIHGMMYVRGNKRDYDHWAEMGNLEWSWEKVLPYFKKLEDKKPVGNSTDYSYHGVNGPMTIDRFPDQPSICFDILQAAKDQGFNVSNDLNGEQFTGFSIAQATQRHGIRLTSAIAYLRPQRENLHVMLNSTVTKILINENTKRAYAVEFVYNKNYFIVNVTKEIIVAAGAINSPQLLLLSGVGPKEDLEDIQIPVIQELPGVGKNLHNHVGTSLSFALTKLQTKNHLNWGTAMQYLYERNGPLSSTAMSQFTGILNSKYADPAGDYPDLQFFFDGFYASCGNGLEYNTSVNSIEYLSIRPINLHPKSRGYLKITSRNPFEPPLMQPNYMTKKDDIKVIIEGIRTAFRLVNATVLKEKYGLEVKTSDYQLEQCKQFMWDSDEYWTCYIKYKTEPENHQVGSCKMGPKTDMYAVVDPKLLVHGITGLRIADSSVIPVILSGNIQAAVLMIGEKVADYIKEFWLGTWIDPKVT